MIYVQMGGRLGNQLFNYASARALQLAYYPDEQLCLDYGYLKREGKPENGWVDSLADYCVEPYLTHAKDGVMLHEGTIRQKVLASGYYLGLRKYNRFDMTAELEYEKKWSRALNSAGVYWYRTGYVDLGFSSERDKLMSGRFEAPEYFNNIRDVLIREFTPKRSTLAANNYIYDAAANPFSVCLSVRRGDFESVPAYRALHSVCTRGYFLRAIEYFKRVFDKPVFILFSDDIEWVRENIPISGCEVIYESGDDPVWEKLRMMSSCSNFIISNSSFSWWSQWLSLSQEKIVVAPNRWFNNDYKSPLITEEMVTLEP